MSKIKLLIFILILSFPTNLSAQENLKDGFYIGVDAFTNDEAIGKIDNSTPEIESKDRYYGYKFQGSGFFIAPEVSMIKGKFLLDENSAKEDYNVKANIGYDFSRYFSAFITYDLIDLSYNPNNASAKIGEIKNDSVGIGSQFNISNDFGVKFSYSQQFENSSSSGGQVKSDMFSVGTVYSF